MFQEASKLREVEDVIEDALDRSTPVAGSVLEEAVKELRRMRKIEAAIRGWIVTTTFNPGDAPQKLEDVLESLLESDHDDV